jgi:hypothetical protein
MEKFRLEDGEFVKVPKDAVQMLLEAIGLLEMSEPYVEDPAPKESMAPPGKVSKEDKRDAYRALMEKMEAGDDPSEGAIIELIVVEDE